MTGVARLTLVLAASIYAAACDATPRSARRAPVATEQAPAEKRGGEPLFRRGQLAGFSYLEIVHSADFDDKIPVLLLLHGLGDSPRYPYRLLGPIEVPLRVIIPEAPTPHGSGFTWFSVRVRDGETAVLAKEVRVRARDLATLADALIESLPSCGKPVVAGFSQGGILSFALAALHPDRFGGAVPVAGWLPPPLVPKSEPRSTIPIRAHHGATDDIVPLGPTEKNLEAFKAMGFDAELRVEPGVKHTINQTQRDVLMKQLMALVARQRC